MTLVKNTFLALSISCFGSTVVAMDGTAILKRCEEIAKGCSGVKTAYVGMPSKINVTIQLEKGLESEVHQAIENDVRNQVTSFLHEYTSYKGSILIVTTDYH